MIHGMGRGVGPGLLTLCRLAAGTFIAFMSISFAACKASAVGANNGSL
jgi:hypothetical protein